MRLPHDPQYQKWIHTRSDLGALRREVCSLLEGLAWTPKSLTIIEQTVLVMAEHVIRHAGEGSFLVRQNGTRLELVTEDRGPGFLRIYAATRETGLQDAIRAGVFAENIPPYHGLRGVRLWADELHIVCHPGRSTQVRAIFRAEPGSRPHDPCPCLIINSPSAKVSGAN